MAKFQKIRTAGSIAGAAMGQTNTITIQRQNRRLEKVLIQARVTINTSGDRTAVTWDAAAYQERLTRIFSEVRLKVSDKAGNNRFVIKASSATLINWARKMGQNLGRYNKAALSPSTTKNIAYDIFVPLFVRHPSMPDLVSNRTCIPLDAGSINDNVVIELDTLAATPALFGCNGVTGGTTGVATITLNFIRYQIWYREMPADVGYVPQELISQNITGVLADSRIYITMPNGTRNAWKWEITKLAEEKLPVVAANDQTAAPQKRRAGIRIKKDVANKKDGDRDAAAGDKK